MLSLESLDVDVLILVDDWKASADVRAPTYYSGRSFLTRDAEAQGLYDLLQSHGAARWHASGTRSAHRFLFDCPSFDQILQFLTNGQTRLFSTLADVDDFRTPELRANWRRILSGNAELRAAWDGENPYAMSLFRFTDLLAHRLEQDLQPGTRVRIVVDQLDWITSRANALTLVSSGVALLASGGRNLKLQLATIVDKSDAGAARYLPLLGLVDSETWAFGRLNTLKVEGRPIREHYLDWRESEPRTEAAVLNDEKFMNAMAPHDGHTQLRTYWDASRSWPKERNIVLH